MKFKPLVIWIWNQNIAISTIVGTSSHNSLHFENLSRKLLILFQLEQNKNGFLYLYINTWNAIYVF